MASSSLEMDSQPHHQEAPLEFLPLFQAILPSTDVTPLHKDLKNKSYYYQAFTYLKCIKFWLNQPIHSHGHLSHALSEWAHEEFC